MRFAVFNDPHRGFSQKTSLIHEKVFKSMDQSSFDAVLVCGDWGTAKLEHVKGSFKAFRSAFPNKKIFGVLGNHDYWSKSDGVLFLKQRIADYAKRYDIHLLQDNPFENEDFILMGFNGWYAHTDPKNGSDSRWIKGYTNGTTTDLFLQKEARDSVENILSYPRGNKKVILVSHFPCIPEAMDEVEHCGDPLLGEKLLPIAKAIFFGHTHKSIDMVKEGCRIINVGSGYQQDEKTHRIDEFFTYKVFNFKEL